MIMEKGKGKISRNCMLTSNSTKDTIDKLNDLSKILERPKSYILEDAINEYYKKILEKEDIKIDNLLISK